MENDENKVQETQNVQNQEKKQKKEKKGVPGLLFIIMLITVLIIGIGGGVLLTGYTDIFKKNNENKSTEQTKISKKIDESKPWVYDAEYGKDKTVKTIESKVDSTVTTWSSDTDLVVPYLNINSEAGKNANKEIEKLYNENYEKYASKNSYSAQNICTLKYKFYENNNILSIVITNTNGVVPGGAGRCPLYIYNFNLDTLEIATNEELAKQTGYNSITEVNEIVNKWIAKEPTGEETGGSIEGLVKDTYFIDDNNKLNFVYTVAAAGTYDYTMTVDKAKDNSTASGSKENTQKDQTTSNYDTAIAEIKKCLNDENWVKNNITMKYDCFSQIIDDSKQHKHTFITLSNNANQMPIIVVNDMLLDDYGYDTCFQLYVVSFENGKVITNPASEYSNHSGHCYMKVDPNNRIMYYVYGHMGNGMTSYSNILYNKFEKVDSFSYTYNSEDVRSEFETEDGREITEDEVKKIEEKYKNCNFYSIETELNSQNIDTYVK
jgi:hypothetical protein